MERVGVVLLHRGEAATPQEAGAFLRSFYSDPKAYSLPLGIETQRLIARLRAWMEQKALAQEILEAGGRSPLHTAAEALAARVEDALNGDSKGTAAALFKATVAYRYCRPFAAEAIAALKADGICRVVGLTLYPMLSPALFGSSMAELSRVADEAELKVSVVDRYAEHPAFVEAVKKSLAATLARIDAADRDQAVVLFTALGLSQAAVDDGDPYPAQLKASVKALTADTANPHRLSYYGRGSIGPAAGEVFGTLAKEKPSAIALLPLGSVVDEVSTVFALDVQLRKAAKAAGVRQVERAPALGSEPQFTDALATIIKEHLAKQAALGMGL